MKRKQIIILFVIALLGGNPALSVYAEASETAVIPEMAAEAVSTQSSEEDDAASQAGSEAGQNEESQEEVPVEEESISGETVTNSVNTAENIVEDSSESAEGETVDEESNKGITATEESTTETIAASIKTVQKNKSYASVTKEGWKSEDDLWYYINSNGSYKVGWQKIGGTWYYFDPDGYYMYSDGIYEIGRSSYYFTESGAMTTGWYKDGYSTWYYSNSSGALQRGWQKIGGTWYYLVNVK